MLSGTFELFPVAEVLGLIERADASGALIVRGREIDGTLYFVTGGMTAGEVGDHSGPVEGRQALEIRLLEVCVSLLRSRGAEFEFRPDVTPAWPAAEVVPIDAVFPRSQEIARDWSLIMSAVESFESILDRTGEITTESITLSALGFRLLDQVDGKTTIRDLARRAGVSLIAVAPEVRQLVVAGAVRVLVDSERALATARADVEQDRPTANQTVDLEARPSAESVPSPPPVPVPEPEPEPARAAAQPVARPSAPPPAPEPAASEPEPQPARAQIVVDRSELLRMFSGLQDE